MDTAKEIAEKIGCDWEILSQRRAISVIENPFSGPWTDVYSCDEKLPDSLHIFSCFADKRLEEEILSGQNWMKHAGEFSPGFVVSSHGTEYQGPKSDGFEYIVAEVFFHSLNVGQILVNQEFVLLFNLYRDGDGNYYDVDKSGEKHLVVELLDDRVRIRTSYLMRYASAKQLLYVQFVDSRVASSKEYQHSDEQISYEVITGADYNYFLAYQTNSEQDFLFSMIYARSIVRPEPVEKCDIWPYDNHVETYPEFIIKELPDGTYERFTCDESKLGTYFGDNPNAPHYLTPVYFKPSVLDRYRKLENFEVTERRLTCGSEWSVEIDNINPDRVMVYLGDLGRDLPESERMHFLNYEISPTDQAISEEVIAQDFFNAWLDETEGPISSFIIAYEKLSKAWNKSFGFPLFREMHPDDRNLITRIRIPSEESQEEFETIVQCLTRLLIDYIDESELPDCGKSGSINKLSAFLESKGLNVDVTPLRAIQQLRSSGTAHAKGANYDKVKAQYLTGDWIKDMRSLIQTLTDFMLNLAEALER